MMICLSIFFLFGLVVGWVLMWLHIFMNNKVIDIDRWYELGQEEAAIRSGLNKMVAENTQLRVALAAGEMTADAKKVAAMTIAAFDADIAIAKDA